MNWRGVGGSGIRQIEVFTQISPIPTLTREDWEGTVSLFSLSVSEVFDSARSFLPEMSPTFSAFPLPLLKGYQARGKGHGE